jgi:cell division protein FtsB
MSNTNPQSNQNTINQQSFIIQQLTIENGQLKDQVKYLENKIKQLVNEKIQEKIKEKNKINVEEKVQDKQIFLSNSSPLIS